MPGPLWQLSPPEDPRAAACKRERGSRRLEGRIKVYTCCNRDLPLTEFAVRRTRTGARQSWCRGCIAANDRQRYQRLTRPQRAERRQAERMRIALIGSRVDEILRASGCVDCGERDPVVLEFDHVGVKTSNVADLIRYGAAWSRITAEITQCEVRCVNCHKRATARRRRSRTAGRSAHERRAAISVVDEGNEAAATPAGIEPAPAAS
jgi:hypothetical protein